MSFRLQFTNSCSLYSFSAIKYNVLLIMLGLFFSFSSEVVGQNGVTISSPEDPGPTTVNPIPLEFKFENAVDFLDSNDITIINGNIENLQRLIPDYEKIGDSDLQNFLVQASFSEVISNLDRLDEFLTEKIKESVISIDVNSADEVIYLTYGNGVFRHNPNGADVQIIGPQNLTSPLDMVIDNEDRIIIAEPEEYRIRVFRGSTHLYDIGGGMGKDGNEFYGPTGLAVNQDNILYVADAFTGSDTAGLDQVKLYTITENGATFIRRYSNSNLKDPYRIAVDNENRVYVSASGGNDDTGQILIFDNTDSLKEILASASNNSPGSLAVDDFGYLYAVNYKGDLNFTDIYQNPRNLILNYGLISSSKYPVDVYSPFPELEVLKGIDSNLDLPVDIVLSSCGNILVSNLDLGGTAGLTRVNATFDFDLQTYKRKDIFSANLVPAAPGVVQAKIENKVLFVCESQPNQIFSIVYQPEEEPESNFDCDVPENLIIDLDQDCNYAEIDYSQYISNATNFSDKVFIVPTVVRDENKLEGSLQVYDGEGGPLVGECSFSASLRDLIAPTIISCDNENVEIILGEGETYTIEDYSYRLEASDNCDSSLGIIQNPKEGESITQTTTINLFAVDDAENSSATCSFQVIIIPKEEETPSFIDCPPEIVKNNEPGKCGAIVNFNLPTASDSRGNVEVTQISGPTSGSFFQVGASTLIFEAKNSDGSSIVQCQINVVVKDVEKPQFDDSCEGINYTANFEVGESFIMPNFYDQFGGSDNCDSEVSYLQDPAPGTIISQVGTFPVNLTIYDDFGNSNTCSFTVTLTSSDVLSLSCNPQYLLQPDENCQYIPDLTEEYLVSPSGAIVTQSVPPGQILNEDTEIVLTATYGDQTLTCKIKIILVDYIHPEIECPPMQTVPFAPSQGFILPDYIQESVYSDNCEIESITQTPPKGTFIQEDQFVKITVTDNFGNYEVCFVYVKFTEEDNLPLIISCLADQSVPLNSGCSVEIPDFTAQAEVNDPNAVITQSPSAGALIEEETEITLTATLKERTVSCSFKISPEDSIDPIVNCLSNQIENYDSKSGFSVPDYIGFLETSDNCGVSEIVQSPSAGTFIFEDTEIGFTVKDAAGNSATCNFLLQLTEEEVLEINCLPDQTEFLDNNCQFVIPDYTVEASVNFSGASITQSPKPGEIITSDTTIVLTASLNGETDVCEFKILLEEDIEAPNANCISAGVFTLEQNGSLSITADQIEFNSTDNCGIADFTIDKTEFAAADLGENVITLTVTDTAGNIDSCQTTITIVPNENTGPDFTCVSQITLELDASGNAALAPADLYTGDPGNRNFTNSKENFDCLNIGLNTITLTYTGNDGSGTCEISVEVVDRIKPILIAKDISLDLSGSGQINISPQLINDGSYDNCGELSFSLSKSVFSCKDLGENVTTLIGEDGNGNITTITATVTITGNCRVIPENPIDHIYIYPNPTPGPFTFAVPQGWIIEKAEVYDSRGRYLTTKVFEGRSSYSMDLTGLQDAVYVLLLYTNEGEKIVRVIIN